jgi:hypothetical protein
MRGLHGGRRVLLDVILTFRLVVVEEGCFKEEEVHWGTLELFRYIS